MARAFAVRFPAAILAGIALAVAIILPMSAAARGNTSAAKPAQETMSAEVTEQYCEEEKQRAQQWMTWAAHQRSECKGIGDSPDKRTACLRQSMLQLDAFEKEHAEVYLQQVRNLHGSHPVVADILRRLKSHKDMAGSILERDDAEPETLGNQLKLSCIATWRQPAARPR